MANKRNITHLLFGMGGVILELRGSPIKTEWFPDHKKPEDIWAAWLTSSAPREFESGKFSGKSLLNAFFRNCNHNQSPTFKQI